MGDVQRGGVANNFQEAAAGEESERHRLPAASIASSMLHPIGELPVVQCASAGKRYLIG
jgi:hypothetical protein